MVIFKYNLCIFGIHPRTVLYPKPCYNEPCYKEVVVYSTLARGMLPIHLSATAVSPSKNVNEVTYDTPNTKHSLPEAPNEPLSC